ncbi:MAG: DNA polymerase III subunit gamma/tau [Actinomycetota bacterium]|nr:DNA polymerase III subunit gamma/tau [Actinomycetota bacterium]
MAYLSLYRKYRPQTFGEILGQDHVSRTLANAISEDRVAHAYLFTGPRGTGKTSTARILAKALNCETGPTPSPCGKCTSCVSIADGSSLDVIEMDAASHSKVDETREILAGVPLATAGGRRKVYVIDEVHMLSAAAFNALLKTLEEPPSHVVFVLATTEAHKVLPTIVSRTQRFDFRRVGVEELETHLAHVAKLEEVDAASEALSAIARHAEGSVRDALSVLDQLRSFGGHVSAEEVQGMLGHRTEDALRDIFDAIAAEDLAAVFSKLQQIVAQGADARQLALDAIAHARSMLLLKTAAKENALLEMSEEDITLLSTQAESFSAGSLLRVIDLLSGAVTEMRNSPEHRLLLEIALVRSASPDTDPSASGLLGRIERLERRMGIAGGAPAPTNEALQPASRSTAAAPVEASTPAVPAASSPTEKVTQPPSRQEPTPAQRDEPRAKKPDQDRVAVAQPSGGGGSVPAEIGLGHIKDAWDATLKEVNNRSKRVWGLLSPSRPVEFDGSDLVVEVQFDFHRSSMSEQHNKDVLADSLHAALGIKPSLGFVSRADAKPGRQASPEEPVQSTDLESSQPAAEQDPVELLKQGLKAEVIDQKTS